MALIGVAFMSSCASVDKSASPPKKANGALKDILAQVLTAEGSSNDECSVPYPTERWVAVYCMTLHESEALNSPETLECLRGELVHWHSGKDRCDLNVFWKTKWCEVSFEKGYVLDVEKCVNSSGIYPTAVELGFDH